MKKLSTLLTAAALILISSTGCKKKPIDLLPPLSQEGKGYVAALIEGNLYYAKNEYKGNPMFFCNSIAGWKEGGLSGTHIASKDCYANNFGSIYIYIYIGQIL